MAGTLDQIASSVKRNIKIIDTTGSTAAQLEAAYNTNYGAKGWKLIAFVTIANKLYVVAEKEV